MDIQLPPITINSFQFMEEGQKADWGHEYVKSRMIYGYTKGEKAIVFILDTGIADHDDLNDNRKRKYDKNFTSDTTVSHPHGTHCAGIVAAVDNDRGIIGVAPKAILVDVQVLSGSGGGTYEGIANAIRYVADLELDEEDKKKRKIISMSLGGPSPSTQMEEAINYAISKNVFVIAAAGNSGYREGQNTIGYPGRYPQVITVASLNPDNDEDATNQKPADYSSAGPEVDISAPGTNVLSTVLNNSYGRLSGTSMACPHIAGIAALLISTYQGIDNQNILEIFLKQLALDLHTTGFDIRTGAGAAVITQYINPPKPEDPEEPDDPEEDSDFPPEDPNESEESEEESLPPEEPDDPEDSPEEDPDEIPRNRAVLQKIKFNQDFIIKWFDNYKEGTVKMKIGFDWKTRKRFHHAHDLLFSALNMFLSNKVLRYKESTDLYRISIFAKRLHKKLSKSLETTTQELKVNYIHLTDENNRIFEWSL